MENMTPKSKTELSDDGLFQNNEQKREYINEIYNSTLQEARNKEKYATLLSEDSSKGAEIRETIALLLEQVIKIESCAGERKEATSSMDKPTAEKITTIWTLSGSGSFKKPEQETDPYYGISWARWSDHIRIAYSAWLAKTIAEIKKTGTKQTERMANEETRKLIREYGPSVLYGAFENMNREFREATEEESSILPPEKVIIPEGHQQNTLEQVKKFHLLENLHKPGGIIAIVGSSPHLLRLMLMFDKYPNIPEDMAVLLCPTKMKSVPKIKSENGLEKSTEEVFREYAKMEIRGMLYYIYLAKEASKKPHPFSILGDNTNHETKES